RRGERGRSELPSDGREHVVGAQAELILEQVGLLLNLLGPRRLDDALGVDDRRRRQLVEQTEALLIDLRLEATDRVASDGLVRITQAEVEDDLLLRAGILLAE